MTYGLGLGLFLAALAIVFGTFAYLLVNARSLMRLFKGVSDGEIKTGPGPRGPSNFKVALALVLHFAAWGLAGLIWLYLLADVRASAPDATPLENSGIVDG